VIDLEQIQSLDEGCSVGAELVEKKSDIEWDVGDLANYLCGRFKPHDPQLKKKDDTLKFFAGQIKLGYDAVKDYARTAQHVEPGIRDSFPALQYGHFREVVRKKHRGTSILEWLTRCDNEGWSISRLREELKEAEGPKPPIDVYKWLKSASRRAHEIDEAVTLQALLDHPQTVKDCVVQIKSALDIIELVIEDPDSVAA